MKDQRNGNSGPGNPVNQIKDKNPGIQQINDDDFHSERDIERNSYVDDTREDNTLDKKRNPTSPQNKDSNQNNSNFPKNENREDKEDEFDENIDKNEDDYLERTQKRQNPAL